jgi:hypothetical protein
LSFSDSSLDSDGMGGKSGGSGSNWAAFTVPQAEKSAIENQSLPTGRMREVSAQNQHVAIGSERAYA